VMPMQTPFNIPNKSTSCKHLQCKHMKTNSCR
jgi:hypothetical protein